MKEAKASPMAAVTGGGGSSSSKRRPRAAATPRPKERSVEEQRVMTAESGPLMTLLADFQVKLGEIQEKIVDLQHRANEEKDVPFEEGASFGAVKQQLLVSYCGDLCLYAASKLAGRSVADHPALWRLLELRTIVEKLRPVDGKLRYQTDKLLRLATTGAGTGADDPLSYHPDPAALLAGAAADVAIGAAAADYDDYDGNAGATGGGSLGGVAGGIIGDRRAQSLTAAAAAGASAGEVYRPPKLASVSFEGENAGTGGSARREERRQERRRERMRQSDIMQALRAEFGDRPETVRHGGGGVSGGGGGDDMYSEVERRRLRDEDDERRRFEEDHMIRLTMTRKQKQERRSRQHSASRLHTLADVGSAADFARALRDGGGLGDLAGSGPRKSGKRERGAASSGGGGRGGGDAGAVALERAIGAVGKSFGDGRKRRKGS
ncbi:unnamed protein product [Phaeothamnion confervicola]